MMEHHNISQEFLGLHYYIFISIILGYYVALDSMGFVRYLNMRDVYGATLLHLITLGSHSSIVKCLLECGVDLVLVTIATNG
jgi:hypothetical protein